MLDFWLRVLYVIKVYIGELLSFVISKCIVSLFSLDYNKV